MRIKISREVHNIQFPKDKAYIQFIGMAKTSKFSQTYRIWMVEISHIWKIELYSSIPEISVAQFLKGKES